MKFRLVRGTLGAAFKAFNAVGNLLDVLGHTPIPEICILAANILNIDIRREQQESVKDKIASGNYGFQVDDNVAYDLVVSNALSGKFKLARDIYLGLGDRDRRLVRMNFARDGLMWVAYGASLARGIDCLITIKGLRHNNAVLSGFMNYCGNNAGNIVEYYRQKPEELGIGHAFAYYDANCKILDSIEFRKKKLVMV